MIILGAGLAGLSAAYYGGGVLYEQDKEIGGRAKSKNINGFIFDEGIHILHTKNETALGFFQHPLGLKFQEHHRNGWIYSHRVYRPYPLQVNTAGLPYSVRADCLMGYVAAHTLEMHGERKTFKNYEEWLYSTLGKGFAKHFFIPYSEKFWTIHPREMTYEWADIRVPIPKLWDVVKGALLPHRPPLGSHVQFRYPVKGGFGSIPNSFEPLISNIFLNKKVTRIISRLKKVQFDDRDEIFYDHLISTLPLPDVVAMMDDVPAEIQAASKKLRHNSILVVNLGIDRPHLSEKHWIHFPEPEISFFRISFPAGFAPGLAPLGTSSISAEVSYSPEHPIKQSEMIDRVIDDLRRLRLLYASDRILVTDVMDLKYAYVIYDHARTQSVQVIHDFLRKQGIYPCGRYGEWAYLWSDQAILSGREAAMLARGDGKEEIRGM